jgi:hypothetical protein
MAMNYDTVQVPNLNFSKRLYNEQARIQRQKSIKTFLYKVKTNCKEQTPV